MVRRVCLWIHRWTGLVLGVYALVIGITGSLLMFRQDLQAAKYPQFFELPEAQGARQAALPDLLRQVTGAYPGYTLSGVDWPTYRRDTFIVYVARGAEFKTVFAHPVTGLVTGEMPEDWIRTLQELHFNLLGGGTGTTLNGIGAAVLLLMCVTGVVVWWPGVRRWLRALQVDRRRGWKRIIWELHGAAGAWAWLWLLMWSLTGVYFVWSAPFRAVVNAVSPLTVPRAPTSTPGREPAADLTPERLLARALAAQPAARPARFVMPFGDRGTYQVVLARDVHGDWDTSDEIEFYFDRYSGDLLARQDKRMRTMGDAVISAVGPLHVGMIGGQVAKVLWAVLGLVFPLLFLTGVVMWWNKTA